jgi:hypothetical protein
MFVLIGRSSLPGICTVCDHSPLNADDCKPNSALRTTVAVFLRTAEKKHALALQKEQKATQQLQQQQKPLTLEPVSTPEVRTQEPQSTENAALVTAEEPPVPPVTPVVNPNTPVAGSATLATTNEKQQCIPGSNKVCYSIQCYRLSTNKYPFRPTSTTPHQEALARRTRRPVPTAPHHKWNTISKMSGSTDNS